MYQQLFALVLVDVGKMGPGLSMCIPVMPCGTCQFLACLGPCWCWFFLPQLTRGTNHPLHPPPWWLQPYALQSCAEGWQNPTPEGVKAVTPVLGILSAP